MSQTYHSYDDVAPLLTSGAVGILPTDTIYGLVTQAADATAVQRLYSLKSREAKPGTIIAANVEQLFQLGADPTQLAAVKQWWPGPVSAVIVMNGNNYLHQNVGDVAMRVVDHPTLRTLLEQTGPLATTSANLPGQPPATTIEDAYSYFGESVDFYLDGGTIANVLPSTIIRPNSSGVEILRQGSVRIY